MSYRALDDEIIDILNENYVSSARSLNNSRLDSSSIASDEDSRRPLFNHRVHDDPSYSRGYFMPYEDLSRKPVQNYFQNIERLEKNEFTQPMRAGDIDYSDEMFLDQNGLPTDNFLENLKSDPFLTKDVKDISNALRRRVNNSNVYDTIKTSKHASKRRPSTSSSRILDTYSDDFTHRRSVPISLQQNRQDFGNFEDDQANSSTIDVAANAHSEQRRNRKSRGQVDASHSIKEEDAPVKDEDKKSSRPPLKSMAIQCSLSQQCFSAYTQTDITLVDPIELLTSHYQNDIQPHNTRNGDAKVKLPDYQGDESLALDADLRIKSLNLRIRGQIQTIKSLESQLQESTEVINIRNKQLESLQSKLNIAEKKQSILSIRNMTDYYGSPSSHVKHAEQMASKYKTQAETLTHRLLDEQSRRQRSDERLKIIKEYSDKTKMRNLELEKENSELAQQLQQMTNKLSKVKKDSKEHATESIALKKVHAKYEMDLENFRSNAEKSANLISQLNRVIDRQNRNLELCQLELKASVDRFKHAQVEVEILNEQLQYHRGLKSNIINANPVSKPSHGRAATSHITVDRPKSNTRNKSHDLGQNHESESISDIRRSFDQYLHRERNHRKHSHNVERDKHERLAANTRSRSLSPTINKANLKSNDPIRTSFSNPNVVMNMDDTKIHNEKDQNDTDSQEIPQSEELTVSASNVIKDKFNKLKQIYKRVNSKVTDNLV